MVDWNEQAVIQEVRDRLTKLELRDEAADARAARMEKALATLTEKVEALAGDIRDAKTGLRVALAVATACGTAAGWLASHIWPFK